MNKRIKLNLPFFIFKKLKSNRDKNNISSRIIKIAFLSVFLGFFVSLSAVSIGKGLQYSIKSKLYSINPDIVISTYENINRGLYSDKIKNIESFLDSVQLIKDIQKVNYSIEIPSIISKNNLIETIIFKGLDDEYSFENINQFILSDENKIEKLEPDEILISKNLLDQFNLSFNESLMLYFQTDFNQKIPNVRYYKIRGVFQTDFPDFDNNYIIGNVTSIQNLNNWNSFDYSAIEISLIDKSNIDIVKKKISSIDLLNKNNLAIQTVESKFQNIFNWVSIFDFNIILILVLMIIISIISVVISTLSMVFERIKMIGILSSIGSSNKIIGRIFFYHGFEVLIKGILAGNLIFFVVYYIQNKYELIKLNPSDYYVDSLPFIIDFSIISYVNISFLFISGFTLFVTFKSISKLVPLKNINS